MFTRDSVIISHNIKTPLTSISRAVGNILQLTYSQLIKSLFANNEQGFAYDPNDLSTMFQDAAGTVPVTGAGQAVGLMLDKSKGLVLGVELNPNTTFDTLTGWFAGSATTAVIENSEARVTFGGTLGATTQNWFGLKLAYVVGKIYTVSFDATYISGGDLEAGFGYTAGMVVLGNANGGIKTRYTFTAGGSFNTNVALLVFAASASGSVWKIDNVSVKEVIGNHAYQTTSSMRPILRKNAVTDANYLEFDGSDDFLQTGNIDFTATDKVSLFTGVRKLSDASRGIILELGNGTNQTNLFNLNAPTSGGFNNFGFWSVGSIGIGQANTNNHFAPYSASISAKGSILQDYSEITVNGVKTIAPTTDQGTGNYGNYPLYIGRRAGTSLPFNGHLYGLIGVGRLTTDNETAAIEKELAKRLGVTLNV